MATAPVYEQERTPDQNVLIEAARPIVNRLSRLADDQVRAKSMTEQRWLEDATLYNGRYEAKTEAALKEEKRSTAFINLTRPKTDSWMARIGDMLFPTDQKNWGISPTPVPKLVREAKDAIRKAEAAVEAANQATDPAQQERIREIADSFAQSVRTARKDIEDAQRRCKEMERAIDDQLVESDYVAQCRDVIADGCKLGTGILKGPMTSHRIRAEWREEGGDWQFVQVPDPTPEYRRVDPWHFYPDMAAGKPSEMEFTFERHLPSRKDLKRLARKLKFNEDAVRRLLMEGPRPLGLDVDHLVMLRSITGEGDPIAERYVMWEYHGALECDEICMLLRAAGQHEKADNFEREKDPLDDYRVILHFCNDEVLKISPEYPLDSGESLYSVWNFAKGETSVFGIGVPNIMRDPQAALNGAWRMMMDNAALSVGPQVLINRTLVTPQDGSYSLRALKVWLLSSTAGITPNAKAFETFNIEINQQALMAIIELAKAFIDEVTGMPTIAQGEQGAATKTFGGMSMLFNSANVVFRLVIKGWDDDVTKPTIRRAYDWNMQFNPNKEIKGDMQVDARGSSVLLVREIQSQNLMNLATNWTTHPVIGPWFVCKKENVRPLIEKTLQTMMIDPDDLVGTQDEYDEYMRKQAEAANDEPSDPNAIRLQTEQMRGQTAQAIAQLDAQTAEKIANMRAEVEIAKLSAATGMGEEEIRTKFGIEELRIQSSERMKAVDVAVEDRRAQQAKEEGKSETDAVGKEIG